MHCAEEEEEEEGGEQEEEAWSKAARAGTAGIREQVVSTPVWTVGFRRDSSVYTVLPWCVVGWIPTPVRMMGSWLRNSGPMTATFEAL